LLTHPTLDLLHQLGLNGMAKAFGEIEAAAEATTLTHPEWLGLLLDREVSYRRDKRLLARLRYARLRHQAAIEDVDYRAARSLDRILFQKLAEGGWIDLHENLILCGPTGVGKSWLASALGHKACRDNRSVLYQRIPKLFSDLALAPGDGRYARLLRALGANPGSGKSPLERECVVGPGDSNFQIKSITCIKVGHLVIPWNHYVSYPECPTKFLIKRGQNGSTTSSTIATRQTIARTAAIV
jgi:hypothetical protein